MMKAIKISDDSYNKVRKIAKTQRRKMQEVFNRAVDNYFKITLGNSIANKE